MPVECGTRNGYLKHLRDGTPPCDPCKAAALGFDAVCTGHHARLENGRPRRGVDSAKDQSYVLGVAWLGQVKSAYGVGCTDP